MTDQGDEGRRTITFYVANDERIVERIDDLIDWRNSSRSEWYRDHMKMAYDIEEAIAECDLEFDSFLDKRQWVRGAILRAAKREREQMNSDS